MKLTQRFNQVPRLQRARIVPEMTRVVRDASVDIKDVLQDLTPVRSGLMRRNWRRRVTNTTLKVTLRISNPTSYGPHVHYKGRPNARVLEVAQEAFEAAAEDLSAAVSDRIFTTLNAGQ